MPINLTFHHLTLTSMINRSPYITQTNHRSITMKSIFAQKLTNNFLYGKANAFKMTITNSKFTHSLNSVVKLDKGEYRDQYYKDKQVFHDDQILYNCIFEYCESDKGAAIQADQETIRLNIDYCLFRNCFANHVGGAIMLRSNGLVLKSSCFHNCTCQLFGQAIHLIGNGYEDVDPEIVNETVFFRCSYEDFHVRRNAGAFYTMNALTDLQRNNFSRCVSIRNGAGVTAFMTLTNIHYTHFAENSGTMTIDMNHVTKLATIDSCNFVSNMATNNLRQPIISCCSVTTVSQCYIEKNTKPFIDRSTGPPYQITLYKCIYDSLGPSPTTEITVQACVNLGVNDHPLTISFLHPNHCIVKPKYQAFDGFSPLLVILISFGIIGVHLMFIHPLFLYRVFSKLISGDETQRRRRRLAKKRFENDD